MKKSLYAPVLLFVYSRPDHTRLTLQALAANQLANRSDLIIYSDKEKNEEIKEQVSLVKSLIKKNWAFKSVNIIEREFNYGLARNIVEGVTAVCNEYGSVIVLEDDIVTSPNFLTFMNRALNSYADEKRVWHISGWNYPIDPKGLEDTFFWRVMNCWGWATWADRWQYYEKNPEKLVQTWDTNKITRFNLDGTYNFWEQVKLNHSGQLNTWAIFWYATIFNNNGLCINPSVSYVKNTGLDGSGENCGISNRFTTSLNDSQFLDFLNRIEENRLALEKIKWFFFKLSTRSRWERIIRKIKNSIRYLIVD